MAEKKKRVVKKAESVRERTKKEAEKSKQPSRSKRVVGAAKKPLTSAKNAGRKEYHPIKLPDNKLGRFLSKRAYLMPKYFRNAWAEIKLVEWQNRSQTAKLTFAVLVFAIFIGGLVYVIDLGLDKVFRELILE